MGMECRFEPFQSEKQDETSDKDREEGITNGDFQKFKEGHSIYEFWLYQYAGVDQMTGRSVYLPDFNALLHCRRGWKNTRKRRREHRR